MVLDKLSKCEDFFNIYSKEYLVNRLFRSYGTLRSSFDDLKVLKQLRTPLGAKFIDSLRKHNWPAEYTPEELKEKYVFLDRVACQLCFQRPIKTRQLFLYGWPSTQKTLLVSFLSKVLRLYFGSSRRNDFTGADNYYDLWVFDQFHKPDSDGYSKSYPSGYSVLDYDTGSANTLLRVLDGRDCRLHSKWFRIFTKTCKVPIIDLYLTPCPDL